MSDKAVRDDLAKLTEAVRDLREDEVTAELRNLRAEVEQLRASRATHHCTGCGCSCMHIHWYQRTYPAIPCAPVVPYVMPQVWCGTVTSSGTINVNTDGIGSGYVATGAAGGTSVYSISN